jgi:gliding motility-associated-like protein
VLRRLLPLLLLVPGLCAGQAAYTTVGDARPGLLPDCYQLTAPRAWQNGAVWYQTPLRLTESFSLEFTVNLGADAYGADGVVLVLQTVGNRALGEAGQGIGFKGFRPSLGVEFDTYQNLDEADPVMDHVALVRDGISNHNLNGGFARPVQLSTVSPNAKDGRDHRVRVSYNAPARRLDVYVDCTLRISQAIDLAKDVFSGTTEVFWGFTSATGGATNTHTVCLQKDVVARDTFRVCLGERLTLVAGQAENGQYDWRPATGLDNPTSRTPSLLPRRDQLYTVRYRDRCFLPRLDSVFVRVQTPPSLSLGPAREACDDQPVELTPLLTPAAGTARFRWSTGDSTRRLRPTRTGRYALRVQTGACTVADSVQVTFHPLPRFEALAGPPYECLRDQPLTLDPRALGTGLRYAWTPGNSTAPTLTATTAGRYAVTVRTDFGCAAERSFLVRDDCPTLVFVPEAFSPNGDGQNDQFVWFSNEAVDTRMTVYDRWGTVVYAADNTTTLNHWDGTHQGLPCPAGTYAWRLDYRPRRLGAAPWFVKRGQVVLAR